MFEPSIFQVHCHPAATLTSRALAGWPPSQTAQSVAMLQSLKSVEGINGPFLIVAPLSTLPHWEREIA
eukprot:3097592-Pleurochrysis_carterae.AAC.2